MSEVNEISVTPKGMGALVAEITEGAGDQAFLSKYAEVCRTLVARWKSDGHSQERVRDFALQFAEGATMRRAELARGVQIPSLGGARMKPLDIPKLAKVMAIANDPNAPEGERLAARARGETMVAAAGYAPSDADTLAQTVAQPDVASFFSGFEDAMEEREPGYKARKAAEQSERLRKRAEERIRIIRAYGSEEAAKAPTVLEKRVLEAVQPFIRMKKWREGKEKGEYETLLGWTVHDFGKPCPPRVQKAIENALPMPTTIAHAWEEYCCWELREHELDHVIGGVRPEFTPDWYLADACAHRRNIVRELLEHGLRARSVSEILTRIEHLNNTGCLDVEEYAQALIADLNSLRENLENLA